MTLLIGGRYEILAELGEGAFGEVYRVRDHERPFGSPELALKMLNSERLRDRTSASRFRREISIGAELSHPNVISISGSGIDADIPWYVMPLADGGSLYDAVSNGGLSPDKVLAAFQPIADAVAFLHENGVLHRDISPNNVLRVSGIWMVTDFGLSVSSSLPTSYQTSTGISGYGSPAFVSPEQRKELRRATEQSDIYSLGKLVQFMSEGTWPEFQPLPNGEFAGVISRATRIDPRERYKTVEDLLGAVRAIATTPPPSTSIADRVDALVASSRTSVSGQGLEFIELLGSLDPDDEYEQGEIKRLLKVVDRGHWRSAWTADPGRTLVAVEKACRAAHDEAKFAELDGLLHGLTAADQALDDPNVRHSVVATLAHVGSGNDRWSYRKLLVELLKERTPKSRVPATIAGLQEAGTWATQWVLQDTRIEEFPQPLRGWLTALSSANN